MQLDEIQIKKADKRGKNLLAGAVDVAIKKAERYGTPLVIKRNGKIEELTPKQMRRIVKRKSS